jgi:purine-nucleoside phosphorylase
LKRKIADFGAKTAIILGSSLGDVGNAVKVEQRISYRDIPDFPLPSISGHAGELLLGTVSDKKILMLRGRAHAYEKGNPAVMRPVIETLHDMGVGNLIITNAAGSLNVKMRPGALMLITDHINMSGMNPLIGEEGDKGFVSMTGAYDAKMADALRKAAAKENIALYEGIYIWFSGPCFETPAEIRAAKILGADAAGMSTVPEVILARRFGLKVAAISVITNLAAGLENASPSHEETKREGAKAASDMSKLLNAYFAGGPHA